MVVSVATDSLPSLSGLVDGRLTATTPYAQVFTFKEQHSGAAVLVKASLAQASGPSVNAIEKEAKLLHKLAGLRGVPRCRQAGTLPDGRSFLALDRPAGQPLADLLAHPVEPGLATRITLALAEVLGAVHRRGVVHLGINPESVLITPDHSVALADLAAASELGTDLAEATPAAPLPPTLAQFAAPEVFERRGVASLPADVYSTAALLYALLGGQAPHQDLASERNRAAVTSCMYPNPPQSLDQLGLPQGLAAALTQALEPDAGARLTTIGALAGLLAGVLAEPAGSPEATAVGELIADPGVPSPVAAVPKALLEPGQGGPSGPAGAESKGLSRLAANHRDVNGKGEPEASPVTDPKPPHHPAGSAKDQLVVTAGSPPDIAQRPVAARPTRRQRHSGLPGGAVAGRDGVDAVGAISQATNGLRQTKPDHRHEQADRRSGGTALGNPATSVWPKTESRWSKEALPKTRLDKVDRGGGGTASGNSATPVWLKSTRRWPKAALPNTHQGNVDGGSGGTASGNAIAKARPVRTLTYLAAVLVLILGGTAAWWFGRTAPAEAAQARAGRSEHGLVVDSAPTPRNGMVSLDASGSVVFTWENPAPQPGDTYSWVLFNSESSAAWQVVDTNRLVLPPTAQSGPLCVEVRLVRHSGKVSEPGLKVCQ